LPVSENGIRLPRHDLTVDESKHKTAKLNNSATNWCRSKKNLSRNPLNRKVRGRSSSEEEAGCGQNCPPAKTSLDVV
jgi:hypothetical protein